MQAAQIVYQYEILKKKADQAKAAASSAAAPAQESGGSRSGGSSTPLLAAAAFLGLSVLGLGIGVGTRGKSLEDEARLSDRSLAPRHRPSASKSFRVAGGFSVGHATLIARLRALIPQLRTAYSVRRASSL